MRQRRDHETETIRQRTVKRHRDETEERQERDDETEKRKERADAGRQAERQSERDGQQESDRERESKRGRDVDKKIVCYPPLSSVLLTLPLVV